MLAWNVEECQTLKPKKRETYIPLLFFACHPLHLLACLERETISLQKKQIKT
jgi:hypothetical protein